MRFSLFVLCVLSGVIPLSHLQAEEPPADLILHNGRIVTVDEDFTVVQALAVKNGKVVAVGADDEIQQWDGPSTKSIDLDGKMVLPGLIDSHVHPTGASMYEADHEIPPMETITDVLAYIRERAKVVPKGEWIRTSQIFITRLREQRYPTRQELDEAAPDHPVFFRTGPDASANSLALKENGIDAEFAKQHPEHVMVDSNGEPTGVVRQAGAVLKSKGDSVSRKLSQDERDARLVALFQDYNRWGMTGVIDRNCSDSAQAQYQRLLADERLTIRMRLSRGLSPNSDFDTIEKRLDTFAGDPLFTDPHPRLGIIGVKVFLDGGMLTGSAFFDKPWGVSRIYGIDDPAYKGMRYIEDPRLFDLVKATVSRDLAFTAHCQGDGAVGSLVRTYQRVNESVPVAPTHSSITHSSFMSQQAITGAASVGIGVDLQPAWLYLDARTLIEQFGIPRLDYFIPLKSLFEAGVICGGGSDHMQKIGSMRSVNPYNPFFGMWVTVTRRAKWYDAAVHPEQALNREQMLRYYTINNAWLMRMEDEIGSLEPGKRADFIIIDRNLLTCLPNDIKDTKVLATYLDGEKLDLPEVGNP
ncbi:MAG: amidohydrolase family protein [Planctomycetaceae bacterium]|nr:amidohydrolase family protein [Planctomycetaceae bacterium]